MRGIYTLVHSCLWKGVGEEIHGCSIWRVSHTSSCQNLTFLFHILISIFLSPLIKTSMWWWLGDLLGVYLFAVIVCCYCLILRWVSHITGPPQTCYVAKNNLEFLIPLSPILTCWVYSPVLPHLATRISISTCFLSQKEI